MSQQVMHSIEEAIRAVEMLRSEETLRFIEAAARQIASCYESGGKLLIAGNGGSLCDAMHFAEELTGVFRKKREALPAIALSCPGHLTCTANDLGYERVFARGIEAYGKPGDVFVALTTSGNSENLVFACDEALSRGLTVIHFLGKGGGKLKGRGHLEWCVEGFSTSDRIQEAHMAAIHIIIEQVETHLFYESRDETTRDSKRREESSLC